MNYIKKISEDRSHTFIKILMLTWLVFLGGWSLNANADTIYKAPDGKLGESYNYHFGGIGKSYWSLPNQVPGLGVGQGSIMGTPTQTGTFNLQVIQVPPAGSTEVVTFTYQITITSVPLKIVFDESNTKVSSPFNKQVYAVDGFGSYKLALTGGELPPGLAFTDTTFNSKTISGSPTQEGTYSFTMSATDSYGNTGTNTFTIIVDPGTLYLTKYGFKTAQAGMSYNDKITASGGVAPYVFDISGGSLPTGVSLDSSTGVLSGIPTQSGSFPVTLRATDTRGVSVTKDLTMTVNPVSVTITPTSLPSPTKDKSYSQNITASGGFGSYTYQVTAGALPSGVTLSSSGILSGTSTAAGAYNFTITATDSNGNQGQQSYTLKVAAINVVLTPATLAPATVNDDYTQTISATNGTGSYSYLVTAGALPSGVTLSSSGILSGKPTAAGTYNFTITATDSNGNQGQQSYTLKVAAVNVVLTPATLASATVNDDYTQTISATGGTGPYSYTVTAGALPDGVSLSPSGILSGKPTVAGLFNFSIGVTDAKNNTGLKSYQIAVSVAKPVTINLSATVDAGKSVSIDLTKGASGAPFLAPDTSTLVVSPSNAGTATVDANNKMTFTAATEFVGSAAVAYTLTNAGGTSAQSTVTINVQSIARADPTKNATVMGIVSAQTQSAQQFASTQISNVSQRLETLHGNGFGQSSFGLSFNQELSGSEALAQDTANWQSRQQGDTVVKNAWQQGLSQVSWPSKSSDTEDRKVISTLPDLPHQTSEKQRALAFWISGVVDYGKQSANEQHGSYKLSTTGISLGADYRWTDWLTVGAGLGYANSHADIGDEGSTNKSQSTMLMLYSSLRPYKHLYIDSIVGGGSLNFDMKRYDDDSSDFAHGSRGGNMAFGSVAVGWDFINDNWLWSPYTRFDYSRATLDAYQESGAGINSLYYYDQTVHTSKMNYGVRTEGKIDTRFGEWHPTARVEYSNQVSGSGQTRLSYADQLGTGPVYAVDNRDVSFGNWTVGLGSKLILRNHVELMLDYSHNINVSLGQYQSLRLTVRIPMQ